MVTYGFVGGQKPSPVPSGSFCCWWFHGYMCFLHDVANMMNSSSAQAPQVKHQAVSLNIIFVSLQKHLFRLWLDKRPRRYSDCVLAFPSCIKIAIATVLKVSHIDGRLWLPRARPPPPARNTRNFKCIVAIWELRLLLFDCGCGLSEPQLQRTVVAERKTGRRVVGKFLVARPLY